MIGEREFNRMTDVFRKQADAVKNIADKIEKIDSLGGGVGQDVTGTKYTIDETEYTAGSNAEIFNDYTNNKAVGNYSHVEGQDCLALGDYSHAEGNSTTASGAQSHAEGGGTNAEGSCSHAEGYSTYIQANVISITDSTTNDEIITAWNSNKFSLAKGNSSHVEGRDCLALGGDSHAEGDRTIASENCSHSEGDNTTASGYASHAEGAGTTASSEYQHVQGKYNIEDSAGKYAFIIGNGTSETARSNVFAIDWGGNIYVNNASTGVNVATLASDLASLQTQIQTLTDRVAALENA